MVAIKQLGLAAALMLGLADHTLAAPIDKTAALASRADVVESIAESIVQRDEGEEEERSVHGTDRVYISIGDSWGDKKTHTKMAGGTPSRARIHTLPGYDHRHRNKDKWSFVWGSTKKLHSWMDGAAPSRARVHSLPGRGREREREPQYRPSLH